MTDQYQLKVSLFGPERTTESQYGPRTEHDLLAQLDVPVSDFRGWQIYQQAVSSCLRPDAILTLPPEMTFEDAEEIRRKWKENLS